MDSIKELREKNIRELSNLENKKQQIATEIKQLLATLGLEEMPTVEFIDTEIGKLQGEISEKKTNLESLMKKYEQLAAV